MAETMIALTLLVGSIAFWGGTEMIMHQHEQAMIQQIYRARRTYEKAQLKNDRLKTRAVVKHVH
ncbi:hypothetical protein [Lactiplantibacillus mudanjiangensis]|uniref:Histidine kinase [Lactobacillus sp.] n=1 Tax=Lactiplantibacillus mudanjiangensis TaxID=1296538 RepID=A0A660E301_9LACO|nr:hypothetical protein [Lactiplantibacillus mudanjiangensis]VDG19256.1 histidine kinase [Lactobacillus sp.] [Lactiplantibacillus mudanjiangensis]VDG25587.1 histidine kinase [Lactobacillus sp.] [Lactiplantibacillus mudanjiangensis]VDG30015.1 histidine kinase [Lactobacillus sp.] [Lactiplantibacillus mudanjiangensis]VDG31435.1 histidine kinase [Lactobacillus sp.] [Lactiplantibacillus mudanjiangensis]